MSIHGFNCQMYYSNFDCRCLFCASTVQRSPHGIPILATLQRYYRGLNPYERRGKSLATSRRAAMCISIHCTWYYVDSDGIMLTDIFLYLYRAMHVDIYFLYLIKRFTTFREFETILVTEPSPGNQVLIHCWVDNESFPRWI